MKHLKFPHTIFHDTTHFSPFSNEFTELGRRYGMIITTRFWELYRIGDIFK
jgi:hypothetical protein